MRRTPRPAPEINISGAQNNTSGAQNKRILDSMNIGIVEETEDYLMTSIPTNKHDVTREADVIEEILRIYGFNQVEFSEKLNSTLSYTKGLNTNKINNITDFDNIINIINKYRVSNSNIMIYRYIKLFNYIKKKLYYSCKIFNPFRIFNTLTYILVISSKFRFTKIILN